MDGSSGSGRSGSSRSGWGSWQMMQKLLEGQFPCTAREASLKQKSVDGSEDSSRSDIPEYFEGETVAKVEAPSKLDRACAYLQREVRYALLNGSGGHSCLVRLRQLPSANGMLATWGRRLAPVAKENVGTNGVPKQVIRFKPDTAKYAHHPDDLVLVWRFACLLAETSAEARAKVHQELLYKTVMQGIRLMHLCDYSYSDVVLTLAYASVYFRGTFASIGDRMSEYEAAHVSVLLIYLAHSFVLDETCPLRCWQKHVFKKYCTLKVLDSALFRLFQMRGYALRISEEEEKHAIRGLLFSSSDLDILIGDENIKLPYPCSQSYASDEPMKGRPPPSSVAGRPGARPVNSGVPGGGLGLSATGGGPHSTPESANGSPDSTGGSPEARNGRRGGAGAGSVRCRPGPLECPEEKNGRRSAAVGAPKGQSGYGDTLDSGPSPARQMAAGA